MAKIDFVLTWVDGSDPEWIASRNKYDNNSSGNKAAHYRDMGTLKYWFRAVEKYAPWVNKIHFVTCGQTPELLNTEHEKLNLVSHSDYMPEEYLPTFSVNPIELNFHRIKGLEEQFVYFNDDTFLNAPVSETDFFKDGKPCDSAVFSALIPSVKNDVITNILFNDLLLINANFNKRAQLKGNLSKWLNLKYGKKLIKNLYYLPIGKFTGFENPHLPNPFLKSTLEQVWEAEGEYLDMVSRNKFRTKDDVNQYLFRYWRLVKGDFVPSSAKIGECFVLGNDNDIIESHINSKDIKLICINDNPLLEQTEAQEKWMNALLEKAYPEKSSFEK